MELNWPCFKLGMEPESVAIYIDCVTAWDPGEIRKTERPRLTDMGNYM